MFYVEERGKHHVFIYILDHEYSSEIGQLVPGGDLIIYVFCFLILRGRKACRFISTLETFIEL